MLMMVEKAIRGRIMSWAKSQNVSVGGFKWFDNLVKILQKTTMKILRC